jgi:hypothetical protein
MNYHITSQENIQKTKADYELGPIVRSTIPAVLDPLQIVHRD